MSLGLTWAALTPTSKSNMALKINTIVEELSHVRQKIDEIKTRELAPLEQEEEDLRDELIKELKSKSMKTVNSELTGELYTRAERFNLRIKDFDKAKEWAINKHFIKVDTTAAMKYFRQPNAELPDERGFEVETTEYLSIRSNNDK